MPPVDRLSRPAVELLQEKHIAILSTILPDGSPHATPVWIDVEPDGSYVIINTVTSHIKYKNIQRDPRVAVTVVDSQNHFRTVQIQGVVVETRGHDQGAVEDITRLSKKYTGRDTYKLQPGEERVTLRIKPTHALVPGGGRDWRGQQGDPTAAQPFTPVE